MNRNIGTFERGGRAIIGLILLSLIYFVHDQWHWIGLIGIVPLTTAVLGRCPMYALLGISTCQTGAHDQTTLDRSKARVD